MAGARLGALLAIAILAGTVAAASNAWYQTSDFFCLYHGARSLVLGHDPYDEVYWQSVTGGLYPNPLGGVARSSCPGRYGYPLWTAVAMLPIGALRLEPAAIVWESLSIAAGLAGAWCAWRAARGPSRLAPLYGALVVSSQPFWLLVVYGQITGVMLGLAGALALFLSQRRERAAGIALSSLAAKPQIVALALPVLVVSAIVRRRLRLLGAALATAAAMVIVPMAFVPGWLLEWGDELSGRRIRVVSFLPTAWGFAGDWLGSSWIGAILIAAVAGSAWLLVRRVRVDGLGLLALSLPLSLFATPYAWTYDFLVLAVSWSVVLARAVPPTGIRLGLLLVTVALAGPIPWVLYAIAFARLNETLSAWISAATALLVAIALRAGDASPGDASV